MSIDEARFAFESPTQKQLFGADPEDYNSPEESKRDVIYSYSPSKARYETPEDESFSGLIKLQQCTPNPERSAA